MSPLAPLDSPATTGELLRTLVPGEPLDPRLVARMPASEWQHLVPAAVYHRMAAATSVGLRGSEAVPATVRDRLAAFHTHAFNRHLLATAILGRVSRVLEEAGVAYVVLKGPVLAERVYPRPDVREYGDLDLLVAPEAFADALAVLEADGARLIEQNWDLMLETGKGEVNLVTPEGLVIDLHWSTLYDASIRRAFGADDAAMVARGVRVDVGGSMVTVPDPEDQLLHLCVHAGLAGAHRMGWLQDVRMAVTSAPVRWPAFWTRAEDQGVDLVAAIALDRSRRCFRFELPEPGGDPTWLAVVHTLDRARPPWRWNGGQASGHFVVGATRTDVVSSGRALGSGFLASVGQLREPGHPWRVAVTRRLGRTAEVANINAFAEPSGGPEGRTSYLRMVAASPSAAVST